MALTRAMLLSGNSANGVVLPGQPQGVTAGTGVTIAANGQLSVDASTVVGLVKLNNPTAYNAYVWPNVDGTTGQFLQTDGAGNLIWADATGYAVVSVQSGAPTPPTVGELWFDCATGTLNVYQNCVGTPSPNWFNVAQPGLPVLPANTSAVPAFASGTGTQADPYDCTVTTAGAGTTVQIIQTVTVTSLAPFQYVPIIDLNAVANGGRFSFTNNYADAGGNLTFDIVFTDLPPSAPGTPFTAAIKVGYGSAYIEAIVNVVAALSTTAGSISGTPTTGSTLTYTTGVASGGTSPYTYAWIWQDDLGATLQTGGATYVIQGTDVGRTISVVLTATDSAAATATATTAPTAVVTTAPFPSGVWSPTPSGGLNTIPGLISGPYTGSGPISSTGCIEFSVNGGAYGQGPTPITSGQTLAVRWVSSALCGNAATGTNLTGTLSDGTYENSYAVTVNRKPNPALANITDSNIALGAVTTKSLAAAVAGLTTTAYITLGTGSTGTTIQVSTDGVNFTTVPSAPSTLIPVNNGDTISIRQTVGSTVSTPYTAVIAIGDSTGTGGAATTFQTVTYTATTVASAVFPGLTFTPVGGPNAAPETITGIAGGGSLGTLEGFAPSNAWPAGLGTTLSSPASGANPTMKMRVGAAAYATSGVAVAAGQTLDLAWNQAYLDTVTSGNTATGTIQGTVGATTYTNTFTMTVVRAAVFSTTTGSASGAAGAITLPAQTPNQYNVPVKLYQSVPGSNALTSVTVDINTTGAVPLPTTVGSALTLKPGDSVVFAATAPAGTNTYTTQIHIGDTVQTWSYQVTVTPTVTTPVISLPVNTSPLNPASNSPAGLTFATAASGSAGGFQTNYSGTQTAADWYIYKANAVNPETSAITNVGTSVVATLDPASAFGGTTVSGSNLSWSGPIPSAGVRANAPLTSGGNFYWEVTITSTTTQFGIANTSTSDYSFINYFTNTIISSTPTTTAIAGATLGDIIGVAVSSTGSVSYYQNGTLVGTTPIGGTYDPANTYPYFTGSGTVNFGQSAFVHSAPSGYGKLLSTPLVLTLTDATDLADMVVGDTVVEVGGGADATGTITAIDSVSVPPTITLSPSTGTWNTGSTAKDTSRTVIPPAPTVLPPATPDATKYTPITGFNPLNITSGTFNQAFIPQASLSTSSKYYASVIYTGSPSGGSPVVSTASAWYSLDTVSSFIPAPGTAYNGGYFGGQINDGGIIYNLIVAPRATGQNGGNTPSTIQWKTSATSDSPTSLWENVAYGFPASQAGNSGTYPAAQWARNLAIGGYNDWYIPASNELEVLYYFLKPDPATGGNANNTSSGSNANAVSPEPVSTNYTASNPAQTTATDFKVSGNQAFNGTIGYVSATQQTSSPGNELGQSFVTGNQSLGGNTKDGSWLARAIRREYANAPVAIGAAFGGGYFAGQYQDGGLTYNLIVAPKATGQYDPSGTNPSAIQYKTSDTSDTNPNSQNVIYGKLANDQFNDINHPAFQWARGLTIATFSDWYIPAINELSILVYNLGPNWTTANDFKAGTGAQAFATDKGYWSASERSDNTSAAWSQDFGTAVFNNVSAKSNSNNYARAVRRVLA